MDFVGLRRLAELAGEDDGPALRDRWISSPWVAAFERGDCDADAFAVGMVQEWGLNLSPTAFIEDFRNWSAGPFPGSLELVRALQGAVQTGCLSNTNPTHWEQHLDRWGIVQHLDWRFTSHEMGISKPDPAVFLHVTQTLGTTPDRVLFLDDAAENVRAARAVGLLAEHTRGLQEVLEALLAHLPADSPSGHAVRKIARHSSSG